MAYIVVLLALMTLSFVMVYLMKRRSGLLILALTAGSVLSNQWSEQISQYIILLGMNVTQVVTIGVVTIILTILPMLLIMKSAKVSSGRLQYVLHAALCALVMVLYAEKSLRPVLATDTLANQIISGIEIYKMPILTFCLIIAIIDVTSYSFRTGKKRNN